MKIINKAVLVFLSCLFLSSLLVGQNSGGLTYSANSAAPLFSCQVLDTAICSSSVSTGNPNFLAAGAGAVVNVNGNTTPLVYFVGGVYQVVNTQLSITLATPAADTLVFIYAKQDTANANVVNADLISSDRAPCFAYESPLAASDPCHASEGTTASATNPYVWFDLSTNTTKICTTSACSGGYNLTVPYILLGDAIITSAPAIRAVLAEPYRLNHYERVKRFGFQNTSTGAIITGSTTCSGAIAATVRSLAIDGGTFAAAADSNNIGCIVYSLTPVIITNSGTFGAAGTGVVGGAGSAAATSTAGITGGMSGTGASGGGGVANSSAGGGAGEQPGRFTITTAGAAGVAAGNNGNNGVVAPNPIFSTTFTLFYSMMGSSGSGGAGVVGSTGGTGGRGGGVHVLYAPSIFVDTGCTVTSAGGAGANGGGTQSAGGGGGGGGLAALFGGFVINSGTITAAGGLGGTHVGAGVGDGGVGGAGKTYVGRLW